MKTFCFVLVAVLVASAAAQEAPVQEKTIPKCINGLKTCVKNVKGIVDTRNIMGIGNIPVFINEALVECKNVANLATPQCHAQFSPILAQLAAIPEAFNSKNIFAIINAFANITATVSAIAVNIDAVERICL